MADNDNNNVQGVDRPGVGEVIPPPPPPPPGPQPDDNEDVPPPPPPGPGRVQRAIERLFREEHDPNPAPLHPSSNRRYGDRPRGVVLRVRDPPEWTRTIQGKTVIREMNRQGIFNQEIDQAYRVMPPQPPVTTFTRVRNFVYNLGNLMLRLEFGAMTVLAIYVAFMYKYFHNNANEYYFIVKDK